MKLLARPALFIVSIVSPCAVPLLASEVEPTLKENLDLPQGAYWLEDLEEEPAPEVVTLYGQVFEGSEFYFLIDRSGSMRDGELDVAKRETIRALQELTAETRFAIFFFDANLAEFPPGISGPFRSGTDLLPSATSPMKGAAAAYILCIQAGSGTCPGKALLAALTLANRSGEAHQVILWVGDGYTTCPGTDSQKYAQQTLEQVAQENFRRIPIHAILVGTDASETFPKQLAAQNDGIFVRIAR